MQALYDLQNNRLQDINAKAPAGMRILVDTTNNKIHLVNENDMKIIINKH